MVVHLKPVEGFNVQSGATIDYSKAVVQKQSLISFLPYPNLEIQN
jgi:hypothetical protein